MVRVLPGAPNFDEVFIMIHYVYEITNNINGKIYVGVHSTKDVNDGYMGSGKHLKQAKSNMA